MAIEYLSDSQIKELALKNAQLIDSLYDTTIVTEAYRDASAKCGFENPLSTDTDYAVKQNWLIKMMTRYFYDRKLMSSAGKFDVEGLKLGQVARGLRDTIKSIDDEFAKAKEDGNTAHLFMDAADYFGTSVSAPSGIVDDTVGADYR